MITELRFKTTTVATLLLLCAIVDAYWVKIPSGTTANLSSVHFPTGTVVGYAAGADTTGGGVVLKTTDGGQTWVSQDSVTAHGLNSIYFKNDDVGFAVGNAGTAVKTSNGGADWTQMSVPETSALTGVQFPENGQVGYIGVSTDSGERKLLKTTDGGDNWTSIVLQFPLGGSYNCRFSTDDIGVVVGGGGFVAGTTDGADSLFFRVPRL